MTKPLCRTAALMAALVVVAGALAGAAAQEVRFFRIATGRTGGGYFPVGGVVAAVISNPPGGLPCERGGSCGVPGLIAVAQATSGSVQNLELLRRGAVDAAFAQADIAYWAYRGEGPFAEDESYEGLRALGNLYVEAMHVVVRADSDIDEIADLRGKRVALGEEGSGTLVGAREVLKAWGLSEKRVEPEYVGLGVAAERLAQGEIDAFFFIGGAPLPAVEQLARRTPIRLLPLDGEPADALKERLPFLAEATIAADADSGVAATPTIGVGATFVADADLDDDTAYGIVRALWSESARDLLSEQTAYGRAIRYGDAVLGLPAPLHPGAEAFYRETGLLVDPTPDPAPRVDEGAPPDPDARDAEPVEDRE